jgi:hypothetical protein
MECFRPAVWGIRTRRRGVLTGHTPRETIRLIARNQSAGTDFCAMTQNSLHGGKPVYSIRLGHLDPRHGDSQAPCHGAAPGQNVVARLPPGLSPNSLRREAERPPQPSLLQNRYESPARSSSPSRLGSTPGSPRSILPQTVSLGGFPLLAARSCGIEFP